MTLTAGTSPSDAVIAALRDHGCNPRQSREGQWNSKCPNAAAHARGDRNPSLSIGEGVDGRALVHCQTGCTLNAVAHALGLTIADLYPPPVANGNGHGKRVVDRYDYLDADGILVFQVERMDPKGFRQRRPDGSDGNYSWIYNLQGVDNRPLYRAPRLVGAEQVWVVEGEKDVHALERAGHIATTCPMGAGKWRDEHTKALAEVPRVDVVADDDPTGHLHALAVRDALQRAGVDVHVWLPRREFKDVAEHLGAGYGLDELRPWPDDAPEDEVVDEYAHMHFVDWAEFWAEETLEEWLVEPIIPKGRAVAIAATAKVGKSLFLLDAAAALATGRPVLGQPVLGQPVQPPVDVLYCDYEMTKADLRERLEDLGYGPDVDMAHLHYAHLPSLPPLDTPAGGKALLAAALACRAQLVAIDTLARAVEGSENDADTYRQHYLHTVMVLKQHGITTVRLDHLGKDKDKGARGSSAKNDDVDVVWQMSPTDNGVQMKRTHSRVPWVPESVAITRHTEPLRHAVVGHMAWPEGTKACAVAMDELGLPLDVSRRKAMDALKAVGKGKAEAVVRAAMKYRKGSSVGELCGTDNPSATPSPTPPVPPSVPHERF